ncbi:LysM peptidoglycan-binding domain-containing protein [uncultured Paraglaciecola sp.]|uniref:LysM peptidoglycan-binding domain-containing protein n=1 Tax=uncultured Paraglaciecola sp. TaxID=1765024 RepID=UPI0030D91EC3
MYKPVLFVTTLLVLLGCSTSSINKQNKRQTISSVDANQVTLSHVKAYLLLGDIKKAEQLLQTIKSTEPSAATMLILAELHAAKGNSVDAQRTFLLALTDSLYDTPLDKNEVSANLLDYFCSEKKWPALEGYASSLVANSAKNHNEVPSPAKFKLKNNALTQIGLCLFNEQHFEQAQKWLQQLDFTQPINPQVHLALARIAIEQNQNSVAQTSINLYEATKTQIDAKMLWTAFEVYQALEQPEMAEQTGENLYAIFPHNEYTRKYILTKKRSDRIQQQQETMALLQTITPLPEVVQPLPAPLEQSFHIIKKGETLYQLSKRYDVLIADLLRWNPDLVVDNISLGTSVRLFAD